ncbi:MAG: PilW family protein [Sedimenticola sp.]
MMRKNIFTGTPGPTLSHSGGFTLVELMIAMFLSLFLMGGVIQLFIQSKTTYTLQEGVARAQESGRISLHLIENHLRRAAYPLDALPMINGFSRDQVGSTPAFASGHTTPLDNALVIQYQSPAGGMNDCSGRTIAADEFVAMNYLISGGDLICESATTESATLGSATLVNGVSSLALSYGVDSDGDGAANGAYKAVADITTTDDWESVVAVQVRVTVPVLPVHLSGDRVLEFSTTVPIRNQMERK